MADALVSDDRDRSQDGDDHDNDQKLDDRKATAKASSVLAQNNSGAMTLEACAAKRLMLKIRSGA